MTTQAYEAMLSGHAAAGDEVRVKELIALTERSHTLVVKGFLQTARLDASAAQMQTMVQQGYYVPPFTVKQLVRLACEADRIEEIFETVLVRMDIPADAVSLLLEDCMKREDMVLASKVEMHVRQTSQELLPLSTYGSLPRCASAAGSGAGQSCVR